MFFKKKILNILEGWGEKTRKPTVGGGEEVNGYSLEPHIDASACHDLSQFNSIKKVVRLSRIHP